ncbi:MAG: 50S ribosomal protein L17 [Caldimicrobium thiodismutans]|jgi:large subunit ribosomal protein L17|uniref:Large ribosomal subunit protein bL17 n=1 Tax=Caldimicrobium thiodismutans TaxID=1653476 RepID=A0A2N7PL48_9BACT|nr:MAG: 50S ribosomal protein L17 [Caldimicrobium thiodismutans]
MRHRKVSRRLVSTTEHRIALMRNQVRDLFKHGRITTTLAKAKELRRYAEKMITLAKKGDLASRRRALAFIQDKEIVRKLFSEIREKYLDRPGGYTRIVSLGQRRGDAAPLVIVELVEEKLTFRKSRLTSERLKKLQEFIERKKREYGLISESKESAKEEMTKEEIQAKEEPKPQAKEETLEPKKESQESSQVFSEEELKESKE